jgi:hypothetical protein
MKTIAVRLFVLTFAAGLAGSADARTPEAPSPAVRIAVQGRASAVSAGEGADLILPEANASSSGGLGVLMPVIGRLVGSGNTLFKTSLDVSNFSASPVAVAFRFRGVVLKTSAVIGFTGTFGNDGGTLRAFSSVHFDDFIDAMVQAGPISAEQEGDGILGSMLIIFPGITSGGQGSARARFYSEQFGGTIGVTVNGHEFTGTETTALAGAFSDTRSIPGTPQLYSNIFINNIGRFDAGTGQFNVSDDQVLISAFSAATGQPLGTPLSVPVHSFQTLSTGLSALGVPPGSGPVVVLAKATSGQGLLLGVGAEVDDVTKDPSGFAMSTVPPSSAGPVPTGDLASQIAGNWTGTWNNTTFQSTGSAALAIATNTTAKTFSVTLTLGGNVFGGSAPPPQTFSGSYTTGAGVTFTGHDALFGDITFTLTPAGVLSGSATNVPSANVSAVTFSGTASAHAITILYTVTLKAGGSASGVVTLTKP